MIDPSTPPVSISEVEQIAPNLFREWACDRQIVIYTVRDISRDTIATWAKLILATIEAWPAGRPFLALFDLNFREASLTPYVRELLGEVMDSQHDLRGCTALVMRKSFLVSLVQVYLRNRKPGKRERRLYFSREEGLAWLAQALDKQE